MAMGNLNIFILNKLTFREFNKKRATERQARKDSNYPNHLIQEIKERHAFIQILQYKEKLKNRPLYKYDE